MRFFSVRSSEMAEVPTIVPRGVADGRKGDLHGYLAAVLRDEEWPRSFSAPLRTDRIARASSTGPRASSVSRRTSPSQAPPAWSSRRGARRHHSSCRCVPLGSKLKIASAADSTRCPRSRVVRRPSPSPRAPRRTGPWSRARRPEDRDERRHERQEPPVHEGDHRTRRITAPRECREREARHGPEIKVSAPRAAPSSRQKTRAIHPGGCRGNSPRRMLSIIVAWIRNIG